jgi:hypothetical protein
MTLQLCDYEQKTKNAIAHFWNEQQAGGVRAGRTMNGFTDLITELVRSNGLPSAQICLGGPTLTLPGYFRPNKRWDMLVMQNGRLIAAIEFKSQVGAFGNNFNNRSEEAIGTAHDFWTAYREGAFGEYPPPFVGWLMLVEDAPGSRSPVNNQTPHFPVFKAFDNTSYQQRYNILCKRLIQEKLYTAATVIAAEKNQATYSELSAITNLKNFVGAFAAHISGTSV